LLKKYLVIFALFFASTICFKHVVGAIITNCECAMMMSDICEDGMDQEDEKNADSEKDKMAIMKAFFDINALQQLSLVNNQSLRLLNYRCSYFLEISSPPPKA